MDGVGNLCQCACNTQTQASPGGHRRNRRRTQAAPGQVSAYNLTSNELILPNPTGGLLFSGVCPLGDFLDRVEKVTEICCSGQGGCTGAVPDRCSFDCGRAFNRMLIQCGPLLREFLDEDMPVYDAFASQCAQLDPRSLATALHYATCLQCDSDYAMPLPTMSGYMCVPFGTGITESAGRRFDKRNWNGKK